MTFILALLLAVLPPCTDDGQQTGACGWNAAEQGNGRGTSYVVILGVVVR